MPNEIERVTEFLDKARDAAPGDRKEAFTYDKTEKVFRVRRPDDDSLAVVIASPDDMIID